MKADSNDEKISRQQDRPKTLTEVNDARARIEKAIRDAPGRSNTAIAAELKLHRATVARVRDAMGDSAKLNDQRIANAPDGKTISEACREIMAINPTDRQSRIACARIGISARTFFMGRDLLLMLANPRLSLSDRRLVQAAVTQMDEKFQPEAAWQTVAHIADRIWGAHAPHTQKRAELVVENYMQQITSFAVLADALASASVPYLDGVTTGKVRIDLERALSFIRQAIKNLGE